MYKIKTVVCIARTVKSLNSCVHRSGCKTDEYIAVTLVYAILALVRTFRAIVETARTVM